jgi:hypothetical protein
LRRFPVHTPDDLTEVTVMRVLNPVAAGPVNAPTRELLTWVARVPRTYAETMEAWRSSCPRFTVWEDALEADLVRIERGVGTRTGEARVTLTPRGHAVLAES